MRSEDNSDTSAARSRKDRLAVEMSRPITRAASVPTIATETETALRVSASKWCSGSILAAPTPISAPPKMTAKAIKPTAAFGMDVRSQPEARRYISRNRQEQRPRQSQAGCASLSPSLNHAALFWPKDPRRDRRVRAEFRLCARDAGARLHPSMLEFRGPRCEGALRLAGRLHRL